MRNAFAKILLELAGADKDLILLTGDLGFSVFEEFKARYPAQYFNAGISEQAMVGMAAGLASEGRKVFVYSIIPFLAYRALEQIRNDLCYQQLPVKLVGVGTGLAYGRMGGTHHAIEDVGVMSALPQMTVFSPGDPLEVEAITRVSMQLTGPSYMRLNRAGDPVVHKQLEFKLGCPLPVTIQPGPVLVLAMGSILSMAKALVDDLAARGTKASLYSVPTLKPVDHGAFIAILRQAASVVVLEEHVARGGLGSLISRIMAEGGIKAKTFFFNLPDAYAHQAASQPFLQRHWHLTKDDVLAHLDQHL